MGQNTPTLLIGELQDRADRRAQAEGPFTKENLCEWRAAEALATSTARIKALEEAIREAIAAEDSWNCTPDDDRRVAAAWDGLRAALSQDTKS